MLISPQKIIISRTDNIGDVVLTLPVAGALKQLYPGCHLSFIGKRYTRPVIEASSHIDQFIDWEKIKALPESRQIETLKAIKADAILHVFPNRHLAKIAAKARIPLRIGTSRRVSHWLYCNRLVHLTRRSSSLHEAQLNLKLISPITKNKTTYDMMAITSYYGFTAIKPISESTKAMLSKKRINVILHPKSKGSAREWGLDNFARLIELLPKDRFKLFITGTREEAVEMKPFLDRFKTDITDCTGRFTLTELIGFIHESDAVVAASTGVLHLAAALGKHALGIYAPKHPIHPGRWAPLGRHAAVFVLNRACNYCSKGRPCHCIQSIPPEDIKIHLCSIADQ